MMNFIRITRLKVKFLFFYLAYDVILKDLIGCKEIDIYYGQKCRIFWRTVSSVCQN